MKKLISLLALCLAACQPDHVPAHAYRQQDTSGDWIYYYIIFSHMNSCPCYSYSSPTPVSDFQSVTFSRTEQAPVDLKTAEPQPEVEIPAEQAPPEAVESWSENFDANDSHESGEASEGFDESSSSDAGPSDAVSSDGGGGDGGGGGGE